MIAKLTGLVDSLGEDSAVIDVGGVGYLVACSRRTLERLRPGQPAALAVETQMREDRIQLFGFLDDGERNWFRLLQSVQGVGAKVALAILGALAPDQLLLALAAGDRAALARADGVGPKLAARIAAELKDKAGGIGVVGQQASVVPTIGAADGLAEAVSALVNLGYGRSEAFAAIAEARGTLGNAAALDALIRAGLQRLARPDAKPASGGGGTG